MRTKHYFISFFLIIFTFSATAKEGMWLPNLLKALNYSDMQTRGLMISAEDIYSVNKSSLKDAVAHFNGGCTSEVVSNQGLLFTNHHCGYSQIAAHSSVEHNYLRDGFWAKNFAEEKKCNGLYVDFIVRIDDVTSRVIGTDATIKGEELAALIKKNIAELNKSLIKGTNYLVKVKPFNYGNRYYAFIIERFNDVRFVGAPPSAVGKFGFDTDNWVWPRHTGDFSVFRIYANKNNQPANYSEDNVPYKPKHHFPISLEGVQEGDFSMVYGFPGRTQQFLSSYAVDQIINKSNPARILMRDKSLEVINATMRESEANRIKYASYQSRVSNAWKKWKGQNFGLIREKALDKKREKEKLFQERVDRIPELSAKYSQLLPNLKTLYSRNEKYQKAFDYYVEMIYSGPGTMRYLNNFSELIQNHEKLREAGKLTEQVEKAKKSYQAYIKNIAAVPHEKRMWKSMYKTALANVDREFHPEYLSSCSDDYVERMDEIIDVMFRTSEFLKDGDLMEIFNNPTAKNLNKLKNDRGYKMVSSFYAALRDKVLKEYYGNKDAIDVLMKDYAKAIQSVFPQKKYWYDANGTLRLTYGKIEGSSPKDGMTYKAFTTAEGIMEKYIPGSEEFDVPYKLRDLIKKKDYGQYGQDGELIVCFTGSNHTTGGNSGSPVINGKGELIGINFDRSWESTMSDIMFSEEICRNISVDIRYVLFIIDKYAGATNLIDEMTLIKSANPMEQKKDLLRREVEIFTKMLKDSPTQADLYAKRGKAHYEIGDLKSAYADYEKAAALDAKPEYVRQRNFLKKVLGQIGEIK